jgi:hypothetical protein
MQRRVTNCDGLEIVVSMTDEVSNAITDWAVVAEMYEAKTEMTLNILGEYFLTKNQFTVFHSEIKYYISKGMSNDDKKILVDSSKYLNQKGKSVELLLLRDKRIVVKKKINKIYNRLLLELFPSFRPTEETVQIVVTPPRARPVRIEDEETVAYDEPKEDDDTTVDEEYVYDEGETGLDMTVLSLDEPVEEMPPQSSRYRYGGVTKVQPQDLYESPDNAIMLLDPILETLKGKVIYEPCCGNGAIVKYLEKKGFTVIARDMYTTEVKHDYLVEKDPEYDVLITNPPFCIKHQFFEKAMLSGKPFILLLPLQFLTPKCSYDNIKKCAIDMIIMNPSPKFLNENADRQVAECAWFIVNLTEGGRFSVERLPDV